MKTREMYLNRINRGQAHSCHQDQRPQGSVYQIWLQLLRIHFPQKEASLHLANHNLGLCRFMNVSAFTSLTERSDNDLKIIQKQKVVIIMFWTYN
jgi:hypothetical protein